MHATQRFTALFAIATTTLGCADSRPSGPQLRFDGRAYAGYDFGPRPIFRKPGCRSGLSGSGVSGPSGAGCAGSEAGTDRSRDGGTLRDRGPDNTVIKPDTLSPDTAPPCGTHTFRHQDTTASTVWVSGSFLVNAGELWPTTPAEGAVELTDDGSGNWAVTTHVGAGRHLYKFIIDTSNWIADPGNPNTENDGQGGVNSVLALCQ